MSTTAATVSAAAAASAAAPAYATYSLLWERVDEHYIDENDNDVEYDRYDISIVRDGMDTIRTITAYAVTGSTDAVFYLGEDVALATGYPAGISVDVTDAPPSTADDVIAEGCVPEDARQLLLLEFASKWERILTDRADSITVHFESHPPLVIPRTADGITLYDLHCAIAYHIPDGVPFDMDCTMYYDRDFRRIEFQDMYEMVEANFIRCILCNENLAEFYHECPYRHIVATWPWQMDAEGEAWLEQNLIDRAARHHYNRND